MCVTSKWSRNCEPVMTVRHRFSATTFAQSFMAHYLFSVLFVDGHLLLATAWWPSQTKRNRKAFLFSLYISSAGQSFFIFVPSVTGNVRKKKCETSTMSRHSQPISLIIVRLRRCGHWDVSFSFSHCGATVWNRHKRKWKDKELCLHTLDGHQVPISLSFLWYDRPM